MASTYGRSVFCLISPVFFLSLCRLQTSASIYSTSVNTTKLPVATNTSELSLQFYPPRIEGLLENHVVRVHLNYTEVFASGARTLLVRPVPVDGRIVDIIGDPEIELSTSELFLENGTPPTFQVKGLFLGRTFLKVRYRTVTTIVTAVSDSHTHSNSVAISDANATYATHSAAVPGSWRELPARYRVSVIRVDDAMNTVFLVMVAMLVICINIGMGCKVDTTIVKEVLRRPSSPVIGFLCQFLVMPLVSCTVILQSTGKSRPATVCTQYRTSIFCSLFKLRSPIILLLILLSIPQFNCNCTEYYCCYLCCVIINLYV